MTLIIGLTGGIGAGKSLVANLFAKHHVPVIDADTIARQLTMPKQLAFSQIVQHFKKQNIVLANGQLDRNKLKEIIFQNQDERVWLEQLLHPLIQQEIERQIETITAPYCIIVIPLLFEVTPYDFLDRILVVDASEDTQITRVSKRDGLEASMIKAILAAQTTREKRLNAADDVIVNDGDIANLQRQVDALHAIYSAP